MNVLERDIHDYAAFVKIVVLDDEDLVLLLE